MINIVIGAAVFSLIGAAAFCIIKNRKNPCAGCPSKHCRKNCAKQHSR